MKKLTLVGVASYGFYQYESEQNAWSSLTGKARLTVDTDLVQFIDTLVFTLYCTDVLRYCKWAKSVRTTHIMKVIESKRKPQGIIVLLNVSYKTSILIAQQFTDESFDLCVAACVYGLYEHEDYK